MNVNSIVGWPIGTLVRSTGSQTPLCGPEAGSVELGKFLHLFLLQFSHL